MATKKKYATYCHKCKEYDPKKSAVCELKLHGKTNASLEGADSICLFDYHLYYDMDSLNKSGK